MRSSAMNGYRFVIRKDDPKAADGYSVVCEVVFKTTWPDLANRMADHLCSALADYHDVHHTYDPQGVTNED